MGEVVSSAVYAYNSASLVTDGLRPNNLDDQRRLEQEERDEELLRLEELREFNKQLLEAEKDCVSQHFDKIYRPPNWLGKGPDCVNIAVAGNSGAGKSSFINAVRGLRPMDPGAAKVGVSETTMEPTPYLFADFPGVKIWDLPGAGTALFPRETYVETIGLRHFDIVVVLSSQRFTETDVAISHELRRLRIPYFMVRSKVDIDVVNNLNDLGVTPEETIDLLRQEMHRLGVSHPFLVSSRQREKYDMQVLIQDGLFTALYQLGINPPLRRGRQPQGHAQPVAAG